MAVEFWQLRETSTICTHAKSLDKIIAPADFTLHFQSNAFRPILQITMFLYRDLESRRLIDAAAPPKKLANWLASGRRTLYAGFDPTSDGLHVGNFVPLMMLRRFQKAGHRPIVLAGGATGMIGDPSGKSKERNLLSDEQIQSNLVGITEELKRFLDFDCGHASARLVNNYDWFKDQTYLSFLRDVGKHFPVNVMRAKDSVKARLTSKSKVSIEFQRVFGNSPEFIDDQKMDDHKMIDTLGPMDLIDAFRVPSLPSIAGSGAIHGSSGVDPTELLQLSNLTDGMKAWTAFDIPDVDDSRLSHASASFEASVSHRLASEDGLSYTEFSYMLLQAYDFVHLRREFGCELQVGGSDQWGNITAGIDLARRMGLGQLYGITCPLLTKKDGSKMGKTESGAIWLSAAKTSPYAFYQYWYNVDDADVGNCLRVMTELSREEIESLDESRAADPGRRDSQRRLAEAITQLIHGDAGLAKAKQATDILFGAEINDLSDVELTEIFADVPSNTLRHDRLAGDGLNIIDAFVESGLAKSKSKARQTIIQGGAYVNNRRVESIERNLTERELVGDSVIVLRSGKKKYALLRFS